MPPLHAAQAVHEVEEYRILDSVNYELATYTPADWVRLFETRFSLSELSIFGSASHRRLAHSNLTAGAHLFRVSRKLALCLASDFVRDRPLSLESTPIRT